MIRSSWSAHRTRVEMIDAWASHDAHTFQTFVDTSRTHGIDPLNVRVLDIGCGANAPVSILLHASGAKVTGIDAYVGYRWGLGIRPRRYRQYAKEVGVARAARKAIGEIVYDRRYYAVLAARTGLSLTEKDLDLRQMDLTALTLPDASVDVVHSNATWEHVDDIAEANRSVARVLRPNGLAYLEIHLFPSLSGGHDLPWIVPGVVELGTVMPWRHLRDSSWKAPVFLNRLRERDYLRAFSATPGLEIVEWRTEYVEGQQLLTDEIRREAPGYSDEELTKRSIVVLLRRTAF